MTVASGTGPALMGGVTLTAGNVDRFTIVLDPDTVSEEVVFVTGISSDTLTIIRGQAGTSAIAHSGSAPVKHVLTSDDLNFYTAGVATANAAVAKSDIQAKGDLIVGTGVATSTRQAVGTDGYTLVADSSLTSGVKWATVGSAAASATQTLTNKTIDYNSNTILNGPAVISPFLLMGA